MKVRIERRGGLVGKRAVGECDDAELTGAQREALGKLIAAPPAPDPSPGADRFRYRIMVIVDGTKREFDVPENAMPEELACIPKLEP